MTASRGPASSAADPRPVFALGVPHFFGMASVPVAPGTFGAAAGLVLWWFLPATPAVQAAVIVVVLALGAWSATVAERHFGREDPSEVVIDEVMGMLITLFMNPVGWRGAALA